MIINKHLLAVVSLAALVALLTGCAAPARIDQMTVSGTADQRIANTPFRTNIAIKEVTGGRETNPMWVSNVSSHDFEGALEASLQALGLLAPRQAGKYQLIADLQKLDQPFGGFNMTVTATVRYFVIERSSGKEVYSRVFTLPYTAPFGDAISGVVRMQLANEGAMRVNIKAFIDEIIALKIENMSLK